jgi:hypothetical protein
MRKESADTKKPPLGYGSSSLFTIAVNLADTRQTYG